MERVKHLMQKLAEAADLTAEPVPGVPVIEVAGESRVIIEGHRGVTAYSNSQICIRVSYGLVTVCGSSLTIAKMSKQQLAICGRIDQICLRRRNG